MRIAGDHRDAILQTAAKLFARKPFHEVLMDEVAEKAGIAKGTIYRYYANKDELFAALAARHLEMVEEEIHARAEGPQPPLERIHAMYQRLAELVAEHRDFFQVLQRLECNFDHPSDEIAKRRNRIRDNFEAVLQEAIKRGELHCPFETRIAADILMGMLRSITRFTAPTPDPARVAEMSLHVFLNGLRSSTKTAARVGGTK